MMSKDRTKFNYFIYGLFSGILISGLILLALDGLIRNNRQQALAFSPIFVEDNQVQTDSDEGKIDLNKASINELTALPGIGEAKATSIIEFREKYGDYEDISELSYVPGIGTKLFESIADLVTVR